MHKDGRLTDAKAKTARAENFHGWRPMAFITSTTQPAQPAVQEPVGLRDALTKALTSTYVCGRVWEAWNVGTMTENDFQPAAECDELLDELVHAVTTIPSAAQPAAQEPVAWADAYAISNLPAVDEAIRALLDDKTADNATAVVQAILGATPPEQPSPVQEPCRECAGEGIQGEDGDGFVSGVTWRCNSCNGTGKSTPPAAPVQEHLAWVDAVIAKIKAGIAEKPTALNSYGLKMWGSVRDDLLALAAAQRQRVVFPTMLRKMWSGGEVQAWLDENVNKENT
jgi:hypothetical protein